MKLFKSIFDLIFDIIMLAVLIYAWINFAPIQVGGPASYVIVSGISMEPTMHAGDLAVMRRDTNYQVGDVVTYRDAKLQQFIIHRIIGVEAGQYILLGDNNKEPDTYRPTKDEIIGKLLFHLPFNIGQFFNWLRSAQNSAISAGLLGGTFMAYMMLKPSPKGDTEQVPSREKKSKVMIENVAAEFQTALYILGFAALLFIILSIFAFSNPLIKPTANIDYQQSGVFFYSAAGTPGIYDTDKIRSGEPIFPSLTCSLNVGFVYNLDSPDLGESHGSHQMTARITDDQSGWQRTIPLIPTTAFSGNAYSTSATLDLCQIETLVASVENETNFHPLVYTLTLSPHVSIAGQVAGYSFADSFEPTLIFKFDKVHFYLDADQANAQKNNDPMLTLKKGSIINPVETANTISFAGVNMPVSDLRIVGLAGVGLSIAGFAILAWYIYQIASRSQEALINIKYGSRLMNVYDRGFENINPVVDVTTIDDLARLAELQNTAILHMVRDNYHYYLIQTSRNTYRYVISDGKRAALKAAQIPLVQGE